VRGSDASAGIESARRARDARDLLVEYRQTRRPEVRGQLVERFLPLVRTLARRYAGRGERVEDLVQVGSIGLIHAIDRFDPERGRDFVSYAIPTITGEIRHHLRDRTATIRVPRRLAELGLELRVPQERLARRLSRRPTPAELALEVGASVDDVSAAMGTDGARSPLSLASMARSGADDPSLATDAEYESCDERMLVAAGLRVLPERERRILHLRYFAGLTQSEIADELGLSQVHVSRLIRSSLERMRPVLETDRAPVGA
jgi:RNA polymerase sigma-B factor